MPNHCQNVLKVRGDPGALKRFAETAKQGGEGEAIAFVSFFPLPDNVLTGPTGGGSFVRLTEVGPWRARDEVIAALGLTSKKRKWDRRQADFKAQLEARGCEVSYFSYGTRDDGTIVELNGEETTWYDHFTDTFGTKWEPYDTSLEGEDDCLTYYFQSAWSPPIGFVHKLQIAYPELSISLRFEEGGMVFMGEVTPGGNVEDEEYPLFPDEDAENYDELAETHQEALTEYLYGG